MFTRNLFAGILVYSFSVMALANATSGDIQGEPPSLTPSPAMTEPVKSGSPVLGQPYFQCSSHHTEDDFRLHYGLRALEECDAAASAVKVCEDFEHHECEVHECRYFLQ